MSNVRELHEKWRRDPEYREAYDELGPEFELARVLIEARTNAGLTQAQLAKRMETTQSVVARLESRSGPAAGHALDGFLQAAEIELVPVTSEHARAARAAWRRFGRGNHPAGLNFGDCFSYALAETAREPLLFKGEDFALTDVEAA